MSDYTVKRVTDILADARTIDRIHEVCFPDAEVYSAETEGTEWWLARDAKGAPAGFGGLKCSRHEGGAYLCRGGVLPAHRGNGIQRSLINSRIKWARNAGLEFLVTDTVSGNNASANNLIECGFRLFDPITPWGNYDNLYWRLEL